jgi:hypothetical protein
VRKPLPTLDERRERLRRGLRWLINSGIQVPPGQTDAGGVYAWLDAGSGEPAFLYSEITGYFTTLCVQLHRCLPGVGGVEPELADGWLERGVAAATWLRDTAQHPTGGILSRKYPNADHSSDPWSFEGGRIAYFDSAMVGYGLMQLHSATGDRQWLEVADRVGQYLLRHHESADHAERYAAFDVLEMKPALEAERWSQHFGPYEVKSSYFLGSLADATGNSDYAALLRRVEEQALLGQLPEGRFATHPRGSCTHLHPHSYTIEGLLYMIATHGRTELLRVAEQALDWMFTNALALDLPLQQWATSAQHRIPGTRADALAQGLRIYEALRALGSTTEWAWEGWLGKLDARLASYETADGGTCYGEDEYGAKREHANAWVHFFRMERELFAILREQGRLAASPGFSLT